MRGAAVGYVRIMLHGNKDAQVVVVRVRDAHVDTIGRVGAFGCAEATRRGIGYSPTSILHGQFEEIDGGSLGSGAAEVDVC